MVDLNREVLVKKYGKDNLINQTVIDLSRSQIRNIDSNTFKGITKLEILSLENNEIEEIDVRLFETLSNLKVLWLFNNKLKEIDRKCFEPLKSIEVIEIYENEGLNALSFIKKGTEYWYVKDKIEKYGSISEWYKFLQQFPHLGKLLLIKFNNLFKL